MQILVFRYGHRLARDKRITTHVALAARAFGASGIVIDNTDKPVENSIRNVVKRFGGSFFVKSGVTWKEYLRNFRGTLVHLTMYGQEMSDVIPEIKKANTILIVVGSEKVPGEFYQLADYNVAIGNQPHSEVSALAIFLHELTGGTWKNKSFNGILEVKPNKCGKSVHTDYLPLLTQEGCSKEVIQHSVKVQKLACDIAQHIASRGINVDIEAVSGGSILHDIGRSRTNGIKHILEGETIAKNYGISKKITEIIRTHAGAGIDAEEAERLGLPKKEYIPTTLEEMIVAHADNLTGQEYRTIDKTIALFERNAGAQIAARVQRLHKTLSEIAGVDLDLFVKNIKPS